MSAIRTDASLIDGDLINEGKRVMQICNACRYCEGYCAVFPAMTERRAFASADLVQLANLCHNCQGCYHACQYAPPHEFAVNLPKTLTELRVQSYQAFAWPGPLGRLFERNGLVVTLALAAGLALVLGAMLSLISPEIFWGQHRSDRGVAGNFYAVMPHNVMAGIPIAISAFTVLSLVMGAWGYIRHTGTRWPGFARAWTAIKAAASLRHLSGNNQGTGDGCFDEDDAPRKAKRLYHHFTMYGFLMCFASTSMGTLYHYLFGRVAPYALWEPPVLIGTVGGVLLCWGTAGLLAEKFRANPVTQPDKKTGMDVAFILTLFLVSFTGLLLLAVRSTGWMGLALSIHLGLVYAFFLILPFTKMVHGLYRTIALIGESRA